MGVEVAIIAAAFTTWYVPITDPKASVLFPGPKVVPPDLVPIALRIARHISDRLAHDSRVDTLCFEVEIGDSLSSSLKFRAQRTSGDRWACRQVERRIRPISGLGLSEADRQLLLSPNLAKSGGAVLVCGDAGAGKTVTASSILSSRLAHNGGFACAIENPPELPLQGFHGTGDTVGYCESFDSSGRRQSDVIVDALRCYPASVSSAMMMIGELRSGKEAAEACRIGLDGHLLFTTMHAGSPFKGIERLVLLAKEGGEPQAESLVAEMLRVVVFQTIKPGTSARSFRVVEMTPQMAENVRNANWQGLKSQMGAASAVSQSYPRHSS